MKLKEWLAKVTPLKQEHDLITINMKDGFYREPPKYVIKHQRYRNISIDDTKDYPLLLECDVIEEKTYDSEYILASFTSLNCGNGKCKQYHCEIDEEQGKLLSKTKV